jgi:hypothetical protein
MHVNLWIERDAYILEAPQKRSLFSCSRRVRLNLTAVCVLSYMEMAWGMGKKCAPMELKELSKWEWRWKCNLTYATATWATTVATTTTAARHLGWRMRVELTLRLRLDNLERKKMGAVTWQFGIWNLEERRERRGDVDSSKVRAELRLLSSALPQEDSIDSSGT